MVLSLILEQQWELRRQRNTQYQNNKCPNNSPAVNVFADIGTLISLPRVLVAVTVILYVLSSSSSGISYIVMEPPLRDSEPSFTSEQSPEVVSLCQTTV